MAATYSLEDNGSVRQDAPSINGRQSEQKARMNATTKSYEERTKAYLAAERNRPDYDRPTEFKTQKEYREYLKNVK